jgi:chromosome segregation ATPase
MEELKKDIKSLQDAYNRHNEIIIRMEASTKFTEKIYDDLRNDVRDVFVKMDTNRDEILHGISLIRTTFEENKKTEEQDCKEKHEKIEEFNKQILNDIEEKFVDLETRYAGHLSAFKKEVVGWIDNLKLLVKNRVLDWKIWLYMFLLSGICSAGAFFISLILAK